MEGLVGSREGLVKAFVIARRNDEAIPFTCAGTIKVKGIASCLAMTSSKNCFNIRNNNEQKTNDDQSDTSTSE